MWTIPLKFLNIYSKINVVSVMVEFKLIHSDSITSDSAQLLWADMKMKQRPPYRLHPEGHLTLVSPSTNSFPSSSIMSLISSTSLSPSLISLTSPSTVSSLSAIGPVCERKKVNYSNKSYNIFTVLCYILKKKKE